VWPLSLGLVGEVKIVSILILLAVDRRVSACFFQNFADRVTYVVYILYLYNIMYTLCHNTIQYNIHYTGTSFGNQCQKTKKNTSKTEHSYRRSSSLLLYCRKQHVKRRGHVRDSNNTRWHITLRGHYAAHIILKYYKRFERQGV